MAQPRTDPPVKGVEVLEGLAHLDDLLEHRSRLAICVLLSRNEQLSFSRLKALLDETDGSLGTHLRKLEDAGYIAVRKQFRNRRPVSWYRLTPDGKKTVLAHLDALASLVRRAARKTGSAS